MYTLNKWVDTLAPGARTESSQLAQHLIIFVAAGSATINDVNLEEGAATYVEESVAIEAGQEGATLWRWGIRADGTGSGMLRGPNMSSILRMTRKVKMFEMVPTSKWLFRLDRILNFEGTTGMHSHPGSGIRCLCSGSLKAQSDKGENSYNKQRGDVWYEEGAYPLISTVDAGDKTTFLRGMILPPEFQAYAETANWIEGFKAKFESWDRLRDVVITLR